MRAPAVSRTILWLLAAELALTGGWALASPRSFFANFPGAGHRWTAMLPPYNEHLTRDVGSLWLGLAVVTVAAALTLERRLVVVTALAWLVYATPHLAFHLAHLENFSTADKIGQVLALSLGVALPLTLLVLAPKPNRSREPLGLHADTEPTMSTRANVRVILEIFEAIEQRDEQRFSELVDPDFEIHWPPSLPYGGTYRDLEATARQDRPTWTGTWTPLQPTAAERRMDMRIVAASDEEVVALWCQRGLSPAGGRFDGQVLGLYRVSDGKLARAQMFYFDTAALASFLADAERQKTGQ